MSSAPRRAACSEGATYSEPAPPPDALVEHRQVADDDGEQVVEVVREPARELADGFHLLRLDECGLVGFLFGDVDRQHEEADRGAVGVGFGDDHAARVHGAAIGEAAGVLVGDALAVEGAGEVGDDLGIAVLAEDLVDAAADDLVLAQAEPVGVALVGEAVDLAAVDVGDEGGDGVDDELQAVFAAAQGLGDIVDLDVGAGEAFVGGLEFGGALAHALLEAYVLLLHHAFVAALLGDVGPQRHEAEVGDGDAADGEDAAVGSCALDVVRLEAACSGDAFADEGVDVALAVLAALGIEAHEVFEGRAHAHHGLGEVEQAQQRLVPGDELWGGVEHRDRLVEQVEAGEQQVVAPALFGRQRGIGDALLVGLRHAVSLSVVVAVTRCLHNRPCAATGCCMARARAPCPVPP